MVPLKEFTMFISWPAVGVILTALALVVGGATAYLKMLIQNANASTVASLEAKIEEKFTSNKEFKLQLEIINLRMSHMESALKRLEDK